MDNMQNRSQLSMEEQVRLVYLVSLEKQERRTPSCQNEAAKPAPMSSTQARGRWFEQQHNNNYNNHNKLR